MLFVDRPGDEKLIGYLRIDLGLSRPYYVGNSCGGRGIGRIAPVELACELQLGGVNMGHGELSGITVAIDDADGAPVGEMRDNESGQILQRPFIVERGG